MIDTRPDPVTELAIVAAWSGGHAVELDFGDGTPPALLDVPGQDALHTYRSAGRYMVTALDAVTGAVVASKEVHVRPGLVPKIELAQAGAGGGLVELTFGDEPTSMIGRYTVNWGDGVVEDVTAAAGEQIWHGYQPGRYTVAVHDTDVDRWFTEDIKVTAVEADPDFEVTGHGRTFTVRLTRVPSAGRAVAVYWGDGAETVIERASAGAQVVHAYLTDRDYIIQVGYHVDRSHHGAARSVTVPAPSSAVPDDGPPRLLLSGAQFELEGLWLQWLGAVGDYRIIWGDGTEDRVGSAQGPVWHSYGAPGGYSVMCIDRRDATVVVGTDVAVYDIDGPAARGMVLPNRTVEVEIVYAGEAAICSMHRVYWGDGSKPEDLSCDQNIVKHQFPVGTTQFNVEIEDTRARRSAMFSASGIPPQEVPAEWKLVDRNRDYPVYEVDVHNNTDMIGDQLEVAFTVPATASVRESTCMRGEGGHEDLGSGRWRTRCQTWLAPGETATVAIAFESTDNRTVVEPTDKKATMWFSDEPSASEERASR